MHDYYNCYYKKLWVHSTIEMIYISLFLQINTTLNKGLILMFLNQKNLILPDFTQ